MSYRTHLAKEGVQVTVLQIQPLNDLWRCAVEALKNLCIITLCDVAFRKIKRVQQGQDVSAEKNTISHPSTFEMNMILKMLPDQPAQTIIEFLCGAEADDGVDDSCREDRGEPVYD